MFLDLCRYPRKPNQDFYPAGSELLLRYAKTAASSPAALAQARRLDHIHPRPKT